MHFNLKKLILGTQINYDYHFKMKNIFMIISLQLFSFNAFSTTDDIYQSCINNQTPYKDLKVLIDRYVALENLNKEIWTKYENYFDSFQNVEKLSILARDIENLQDNISVNNGRINIYEQGLKRFTDDKEYLTQKQNDIQKLNAENTKFKAELKLKQEELKTLNTQNLSFTFLKQYNDGFRFERKFSPNVFMSAKYNDLYQLVPICIFNGKCDEIKNSLNDFQKESIAFNQVIDDESLEACLNEADEYNRFLSELYYSHKNLNKDLRNLKNYFSKSKIDNPETAYSKNVNIQKSETNLNLEQKSLSLFNEDYLASLSSSFDKYDDTKLQEIKQTMFKDKNIKEVTALEAHLKSTNEKLSKNQTPEDWINSFDRFKEDIINIRHLARPYGFHDESPSALFCQKVDAIKNKIQADKDKILKNIESFNKLKVDCENNVVKYREFKTFINNDDRNSAQKANAVFEEHFLQKESNTNKE